LRNCKCEGFTYFGILITVALLGSSLAAIGASWSVQKRRANEAELILIGQTFRRAIASYYNSKSAGANQYPTKLDDLLSDTRGGKMERHLRKVYRDPITGDTDWEIVRLADGAIIGLASRSSGEPFKKDNFNPWEASFTGAKCYCDWRFLYLPQLVGDTSVTP